MAVTKTAIPNSPSGYWSIELSDKFDAGGVWLLPGRPLTVDRTTLDTLVAEGIVKSVIATD